MPAGVTAVRAATLQKLPLGKLGEMAILCGDWRWPLGLDGPRFFPGTELESFLDERQFFSLEFQEDFELFLQRLGGLRPVPRGFALEPFDGTRGAAFARYGEPTLIAPRIGQGAFRLAVTAAYDRACAVTGEHSLPALEAAHIKPYAEGGLHAVNNGLLLRSDLHRLFDRNYLTVTPDFRLRVSGRLRDHFSNGKSYYPLDGQQIVLPRLAEDRPDRELLEWHSGERFQG